MTVQIAAASTALILGEDRRNCGRWQYGKAPEMSGFRQSSTWREPVAQCGLILDILGRDALRDPYPVTRWQTTVTLNGIPARSANTRGPPVIL